MNKNMKAIFFPLLFTAIGITAAIKQHSSTMQAGSSLSNTAINEQMVNQSLAPESEYNIQVALLLDCSGSMDGLIEQAKSQLWKMVNALATTKRDGKAPHLEIALYEYGKDNNPATEGYVQQLSPLSTDLDKISELLFAMKTNGGEEYCGHVIKTATEKLEWSKNNNDLKIIIIAGNEPFTQGNVDFRESCKNAIKKGIIINTIHCGNCETGVQQSWKEGADLADGQYMCINTDAQVVHVPTPFDDDIIKLNSQLNDTYIGYGTRGQEMKERQVVQDKNASEYGAANMATRAATKSSSTAYQNDSWDAVDAAKKDSKIVEKIANAKDDEKAPEFKGLNEAQIKAKIEEKAKEREEIQAKIRDLSVKAENFRAEEAAKNATNGQENSLDAVMLKTMKTQAKAKGFE